MLDCILLLLFHPRACLPFSLRLFTLKFSLLFSLSDNFAFSNSANLVNNGISPPGLSQGLCDVVHLFAHR